ncbi:MAG: AAA family ATPase [Myxococcales bacterium]|nr:AAA family ATPase [Myxococcales bacterium]MCB9628381.1 AAA family ATPase [Sandaracinaceae bacterium]
MLVALSVKNFKSIRSARVRFGSLTCLVGHNGVGKSNLFDAIHLLSMLSDHDIFESTREIRRTADGSHSPLDLVYGRDPSRAIELSADMIVPLDVQDDFGQYAKPSTTLLTYTVRIRYATESDRLVVDAESLTHAKLGNFSDFTRFDCSPRFRASVAVGSRRGGPLISTDAARGAIVLHGDGGSRGRPAPVGKSPLTVVGGTNTFDYPTVLAAKREMASWRILHLEPSAMRTPDVRSADPHVNSSGGHMPATLHALVRANPNAAIEVVNRLRQLNSDVSDLQVHADDARDQIALMARIPGVDQWLYGRSLSDGTLRYIALALMLVDVQDRAVLCLEEPENGIHPSRIPNLVDLLRDYAVDLEEPVDSDNPLRQVIINTHSPEVARQLSYDEMVFAERSVSSDEGTSSVFRPVIGTWRVVEDEDDSLNVIPKDKAALADFIGGSPVRESEIQLALEFGTAR